MNYYVTFKVDVCYTAEVQADTLDEAKRLASKAFSEADFGEATDIDGEMVTIENGEGKQLWEV